MRINDWGQLWDDILVMDQAQSNNVDVPDLLLEVGNWCLVQSPGKVRDQIFLDNF